MRFAAIFPLLLAGCPTSSGPASEEALASASITSTAPLYPDSWFLAQVTLVDGWDGEAACQWVADGSEVAQTSLESGVCQLDGLEAHIPEGAELRVRAVGLRDGQEVDSLESEVVEILDFPVGAVTELGGGSLVFVDTQDGSLSDRLDLILDPDDMGLDATTSATEKAGYPMHVLYTPERDTLLVTSSTYGVIWEIDPQQREIIDYVRPSTQNYWIIFTEDAEHFWMTDMQDPGGLALCNRDYEIEQRVESGSWPITMLHDPGRDYIYVAHHDDAWVTVHDDETLEEVDKLDHTLGPYWVALHPDNESLWVVTEFDDSVSRWSFPDFELVDSYPVDDLPNYIHFLGDGSTAYVTSFHEGNLALLDTETGEIIDHVDAGTGAVGIVARDDGRMVYVPNSLADSISVVDTITHQVVDIWYGVKGPRWIEWMDPEHGN